MYFRGAFDSLPLKYLNQVAPRSFVQKLNFIGKCLTKDFLLIFSRTPKEVKGKLWLVSLTSNNYNSLEFLLDKIENTRPVYVKNNSFILGQDNSNLYPLIYNLKFFYDLLALICLPVLIIFSVKRKLYKRHWVLIFNILGYYFEAKRILKKWKPEALVFANDHLVVSRCMLLAAKKLNIKTIYIQHACVTHNFPPLEFDLSLLEGEDSQDKYVHISGEVRLIGMPKFEHYRNAYAITKEVTNIGISINEFDDIKNAIILCQWIYEAGTFNTITIRPHPAIKWNHKLPDYFIISDPSTETSFEYLSKIQVHVSGDSSIHLEAVLMGAISLYYNFTEGKLINDFYGFLNKGLIFEVKNVDQISLAANNFSKIVKRQFEIAEYYNESIKSSFKGKSADKVVSEIKNLLND